MYRQKRSTESSGTIVAAGGASNRDRRPLPKSGQWRSVSEGGNCPCFGSNPKILICDEATSALDVTVQMQIIELLNDCRKKWICRFFSSVMIWHWCSICATALSLCIREYCGTGRTERVINAPENDYTKMLIEAAMLGQ